MKYLQVVCMLCIIAIAHAGEDSKTEEEEKFIEECRKETNASDKDLEILDSDEFPKTKTEHCLTACYYKKIGVINADNTINIEKAIDEIADMEEENKEVHGKLVKIMKDCNTKYTPVKECDSIKTYFACMEKSAEEAGISLIK